MMNSRERVQKPMKMEQPDRVPVMSQFSIGFMNQQLKETGITPMELWYDVDKYAEALLWLRKRFDFDGILVSLHGHDLKWREKIVKLEMIEGIEKVTFKDRTETFVDDDLLWAIPLNPERKNQEEWRAGENIIRLQRIREYAGYMGEIQVRKCIFEIEYPHLVRTPFIRKNLIRLYHE